jgi:hypothetical protein
MSGNPQVGVSDRELSKQSTPVQIRRGAVFQWLFVAECIVPEVAAVGVLSLRKWAGSRYLTERLNLRGSNCVR